MSRGGAGPVRGAARRAAALAALALLAGSPAPAQEVPAAPAPRPPASGWRSRAEDVPVRYALSAQLVESEFDDTLRIVGDGTIVWHNASREPVQSIYLHCYPNAFRNTRSTFLREAAREERELPEDMAWGEMPLPRISVLGQDLAPSWVSPDDGNPDDRTVARADLPEPVPPDGRLALKVAFTVDLPRVVARMGRHRGFVMAAQWFPKLGRYVGRESPLGNAGRCEGWYCPQYHASSEFAADFADYDVTLVVPPGWSVGATGVPQGAAVADARSVRHRFVAESVVDFAWTASRRFRVHERDVVPVVPDAISDPVAIEWRRVRALLDLPPEDVALPPVHVTLLLQPEHDDQAERHFEAARVALGLFGTWLGPYPYGRLTVVDPPWAGAAAGGMEYPMLVTAGTTVGAPPESQRPEGVTVHEIGHQWLMGVLASNESEEAWLDEGLDTYLTAQALHLAYGPARQYSTLLGLHFDGVPIAKFAGVASGWPEALGLPEWATPPEMDVFRVWRDAPPLTYVPSLAYRDDPMLPSRRSYRRRAGWDPMVRPGWTYADRTSYAVNAYSRPALFLASLRRSLAAEHGRDEADRRFVRALREYARAYRFRHPGTDDLLRTLHEQGADPYPLADQLVRTTATLDYAVESLRPDDDPELEGIGADRKGGTAGRRETGAAPRRSVVRVRRRGEAVVPVTLEVARASGGPERVRWSVEEQARERWRDFAFAGEVVSARVDPDRVFLQDLDLSNNSATSGRDGRPAAKWSVRFLGWLENALLSYGRFF